VTTCGTSSANTYNLLTAWLVGRLATHIKTHKLLQVCKQVVTNLFTSYRQVHTQKSRILWQVCQQVVFALLVTSCQQVWNKLLTICNNLYQACYKFFPTSPIQSWYSSLLQPCVVNFVTLLFIMTVSDLLEQPCDKSDNVIKLVTTGNKQCEATCWQLVNRFVTTCLQICNNLWVSTCVLFALLVPSCCNKFGTSC
jgi:hypothetical protein